MTVNTSLKPVIQSLKEHTKPLHEDTKLQEFGPFQGQQIQAALCSWLSFSSPNLSLVVILSPAVLFHFPWLQQTMHPSTHPTGPPLPLTHCDDCLTHAFPT